MLLFGRWGACSCLSLSTSVKIICLWLQSEEGKIGICFLFVERCYFSFFYFFSVKQRAEAPHSCGWGGAGLGSGRDSTGRWVGSRIWPLPGLCVSSAELLLEVLLVSGQARGWWDKSWFSQQLCNSSPSGRCKNILKMTFFFSLVFYFPAPFLWKLSCPGCQFKSSLNHSRHVHRISAPSVIYTVLPGPLCSVTEK